MILECSVVKQLSTLTIYLIERVLKVNIHDYYVIRKPALPKSYIDEIYGLNEPEKYILDLVHNKQFMERILIASHDLYEDLVRIRSDNKISNPGMINKVMKYMLRMSSRTMPFGLFSGISRRSFSKQHCDPARQHKKVRVSVEWAYNVSKLIESQLNENSTVHIYRSQLLREMGDYFYLDAVKDSKINRVEFKKNNFLIEILNYLQQPREIKEIISHFNINKSEIEVKEKILNSIKTLLQHDILYSQLRPDAIQTEENFLDQIIKLEHDLGAIFTNQIKLIKQLISDYEKLAVGEGIASYILLKQKMKEVCSSDRYIVVDLFLDDHCDHTPRLTIQKVTDICNELQFLKTINFSNSSKIWDEYTSAFSIRFGMYQEISLLDLIDSDTGIGMPVIYNGISEEEVKLNQFIVNLIHKSVMLHDKSIKLTENQILYMKEIVCTLENQKIKEGYDFKFSLITENNHEKVLLGDFSFSPTAGSCSGRFYDSKILGIPKYADEEYISAEINVIPDHYGDIGITYHAADYQININSGHCSQGYGLEITDLYVGKDQKGLYMKSKSLGKKVLPITSHLLQYRNFSENPAIIFLSEFGKYKMSIPNEFTFEYIKKLKYIPRFEYNNIILSPARWNISVDAMEIELSLEGISVQEYLEQFIKIYSVGKIVNVLRGDQELPVYTDTELGMKLIMEELRRLRSGQTLTLIEALEVCSESSQPFISDYIVTILPEMEHKITHPTNRVTSGHDEHQLMKYDLSWECYHIYYRQGKRIPTVLKSIEYLEQIGVDQYFFINYNDSEDHIRLRFKNENEHLDVVFKQFLMTQVESQVIKRFAKELFLPEYDRYGGIELSINAYNLFCLESQWFYQLYKHSIFKGKTNLEIGIIICVYTVMDMFENYENGLRFLDAYTELKGRKHLKEFKNHRKHYIQLGRNAVELYDKHHELSHQRRMMIREYMTKIIENFDGDRSFYILSSLIHMSLNRFIGIDPKQEQEIHEYSGYIYYNMKHQLNLIGGLT